MSPDLLQTKFCKFFTNANRKKKPFQNQKRKIVLNPRGIATKHQGSDPEAGSKRTKAARELSSDEDFEEDDEECTQISN